MKSNLLTNKPKTKPFNRCHMPKLKETPDYLRVDPMPASSDSVNREERRVLGYVVAQEGTFKSNGRGQFTRDSLEKIVELGNDAPRGLRVRFGHPTLSDDGLGKYVGRATNFRIDEQNAPAKVRADLKVNATAMKEPPQGGRPLGEYVMHLAETDPGAFSSSLVLKTEKTYQYDENDNRTDEPPVWTPTELYASDVVDTGDAVDDFLSADFLADLPTGRVYEATKLIDKQFEGQSREATEARLLGFVRRYLESRHGSPSDEEDNEMASDNDRSQNDERFDKIEAQLGEMSKAVLGLTETIDSDRKARLEQDAKDGRAKKITALCAMVGLDSAKANEFIADDTLSVEDVKDQLLAIKIENMKPAGDDQSGDDQSGATKLGAEFEQNKDIHRKMGVKKEAYVKHFSEEDEDELMSPEWAEAYRERYAKEVGIG